jgi:sialate O-acetylesterase
MVRSRIIHIKTALAWLLLTFCLRMPASAQGGDGTLRLASILQDKMVVQQGKPFTLWGWAAPGTVVEARASWLSTGKAVVGVDGKWSLPLDVPKARRGDFRRYSIDIVNGKNWLTLEDLLIGEVWFCSGQSNMEMVMQPVSPWTRGVTDYEKEIAAADHPNLRICKIVRETSDVVRDTLNAKWSMCSPATVAPFSGVAYYFGRRLLKELEIPVGMVVASYGGASCQAFMRRELLESDPVLRKNYLEPDIANPKVSQPHLRPSLIYNAIIHPLMKLSIRGILWYQGESNAGDINGYAYLNKRMIDAWREEFAQGSLPFYYVQMTPYNWDKDKPASEQNPTANRYARFRETQESIFSHPNTGMVCTMDVGEPNDIHPIDKRPVGERLAGIALARDYDRKVVQSGPRYRSMRVKSDRVTLKFDKEGLAGGLRTRDGQTPRHFFLSGADSTFKPATAVIRGKNIVLKAEGVDRPVAVRYAFTNYPVTNLENSEGWPAFPFRTDAWKGEKVLMENR